MPKSLKTAPLRQTTKRVGLQVSSLRNKPNILINADKSEIKIHSRSRETGSRIAKEADLIEFQIMLESQTLDYPIHSIHSMFRPSATFCLLPGRHQKDDDKRKYTCGQMVVTRRECPRSHRLESISKIYQPKVVCGLLWTRHSSHFWWQRTYPNERQSWLL